MELPEDQQNRAAVALASFGLAVSIGLGSWWTATAVIDGSTFGVFLRFSVSVAAGLYYLVMLRVARGQSLAFDRI